ncbi:MFS transporter [Caballeronia sp. LZ062]|uniref:MFS transporter n=1 Tax=unclassified Caballeronia TaxID=2646786 RepID=UPI00285915BF|nr:MULTISPECIES: MFS transporter [unclassified Caballeronia]MDR5857709.1 MFS transporter [Caballeronia sp. LZ050]MDR5869259.1 MFS transporter [Caballeronia sp. LZ062]
MPAYLALALVFMINMAGTTLPTAIYHDYQKTFGFGPATITVIFASYAAGVLGALLTMGSWSDQLGRKRMLIAGLAASAVSALTFLFADGLVMLLVGRLVSGISAGIFTATATVAVIESTPADSRSKAMLAATSSNMLGLGLGPVLSGALVEFAPWPMRLSYVAHMALLVLALLLLFRVPETVRVSSHPKLHMQRIALPREVRAAFVPAALSGFAGFVVVGFFTAVSPQLMRNVLDYHSSVLIGLAVFLIFVCSAIGQAVEKRIAQAWRQRVGCVALVVGLVLLALCAWRHSSTAFVAGTVLCGIGQGISFRAALGELSNRSPAERKAEVTAAFFVVLYVAISLPVIGLGVAVQSMGIAHATMMFAAITVVIVLISLALLQRVERVR